MGFFSSIQAKVAAISVSAMSVYSIAKMLPKRLEAFNEGNYVEAFLGKKWAKILDPDAYADENTKGAETAKENESDLQPIELTELRELKGFDAESGTFNFMTPDIAFDEFQNRMRISDESLHSVIAENEFDGYDLQSHLSDAKLYAMAALGQVDGAIFAKSPETAQICSDYFKNLQLTDEDKEFYKQYIDNIDYLSKKLDERYEEIDEFAPHSTYVSMDVFHKTSISAIESTNPQTSEDYFKAISTVHDGTVPMICSCDFDSVSGLQTTVTPELVCQRYDEMKFNNSDLNSTDNYLFQSECTAAKIYAMCALGEIDGAYFPMASPETAQAYSDYFKNLNLTDEQKESYRDFIENVDVMGDHINSKYVAAGEPSFRSTDRADTWFAQYMNDVSNAEKMNPQTSEEKNQSLKTAIRDRWDRERKEYEQSKESTSDAKQTRDPSLQAETDALAALGDSSASTELSYGG